MMWLAHIYHGR